jgi:beta-glucanase (GH16 family)
MNFHYNNSNGRNSKRGHYWAGPDFSASFHRYAVDWRPDAIIWYVDGIERWRYKDAAHIPNIPMYLLVNLAVGGIGPGAPEASTVFPSYYEIDYVKVWRRASRSN